MTTSREIYDSAIALYDGGWRSSDRDWMIEEYDLDAEKADAICIQLKKIEEELQAEATDHLVVDQEWVAVVTGDDGQDHKIGITLTGHDDPARRYDLVADNGDDISTGGFSTRDEALDAIVRMWSWDAWNLRLL